MNTAFGLTALCLTLPLIAQEGAQQTVQISNSEIVSFAPGGVVRRHFPFLHIVFLQQLVRRNVGQVFADLQAQRQD